MWVASRFHYENSFDFAESLKVFWGFPAGTQAILGESLIEAIKNPLATERRVISTQAARLRGWVREMFSGETKMHCFN